MLMTFWLNRMAETVYLLQHEIQFNCNQLIFIDEKFIVLHFVMRPAERRFEN